jgi:shikimate kinase
LYYTAGSGRSVLVSDCKELEYKRVALIGHSGAGKTSSLLRLGYPATADMDVGLGTTHCPSLADALDWIVTRDSKVVVVSNHEGMLVKMLEAKRANPSRFRCFLLVYLHMPPEELRHCLARPTAGGYLRPRPGAQYTIDNYASLHTLYSQLADEIVECAGKSAGAVAAEVSAIASRLDEANV